MNNEYREKKPKATNPYKLTGGSLKLYNYILAVIASPIFQKEIREIREFYGIPPSGFKKIKPFQGVDPVKAVLEPDEIEQALKKMRTVIKKYDLDRASYPHPFEDYLFYNSIDEDAFDDWESIWDLCSVTDTIRIKTADQYPHSAIYLDAFPVLLMISPYASENDIVKFVKKNYTRYIEPRQKKFQRREVVIRAIKSKNMDVEKRNTLVRENKHLPIKEIRKILVKAGYIMDDGYISKIRSEAKRKDL